uniref:Octanoyl-[acyl-carrier-protein]:protein N-octanoyltransferase LIPT2, mitochondrial n=1 Tax=Glossina pallidipes TaxID=7398 RepID=A0A1A9ZZQ8_GLOPL
MTLKSRPLVSVLRIGLINYNTGLQLQKMLSNQSIDHRWQFHNYLVLQEHNPVYTIGIRTKDYLEEDEKRLRKLGAEFYRTNRGGLITFHGPGQLVAYPIIHLQQFTPSMRWYVSTLEELIIRTCRELGIAEATRTEHTGIWVKDRKICAIGVHGSRYITTHGVGLNCCTNLKWFEHITPCGIEGKGVTSLSEQLERQVTVEESIEVLLKMFTEVFQCQLCEESSNT